MLDKKKTGERYRKTEVKRIKLMQKVQKYKSKKGTKQKILANGRRGKRGREVSRPLSGPQSRAARDSQKK
jgi:hypothetical protein